MYKRSFVREGDTLSPGGGKVQPVPQQFPSTYDGKLACHEGDPVYCNTCKSWGATKCVPPFRPCTDSRGRQANLDGDLCLCRCQVPPRLKARFHDISMNFEAYELAHMAGAIGWQAYAGHLSDGHEIVYEIFDALTEEPVEGMTYKLVSGSRTLLDDQKLEGGRSKAQSFNEHPDLSFIAWINGAKG